VSVIGTEEPAVVPSKLLKTHPDIGLDVLHQVADMNLAICVRKSRRNQNLTRHAKSGMKGFNQFKADKQFRGIGFQPVIS